MPKAPLLLDVDTGVDDAMAIALASCLENYELIAVTTVAGNVPITSTTPNTLRVLDWIGCKAPVYQGMHGPLARPLFTAGEVHGNDGLGGWKAPKPSRSIEATTAPEAIIQMARENAGDIVFAFVGPLTNLAVALQLEPALPELVSRLVIMGGAFFKPGNVTRESEFNIFVDPEAAALIARSTFNATWIGLDVTHQTYLEHDHWEKLATATDRGSQLIHEVCRQSFEIRGVKRVSLHDPLAIACVDQPALVDTTSGEITVDVGDHARGRTRVSAGSAGHGHAAHSVDAARFHELFQRICRQ